MVAGYNRSILLFRKDLLLEFKKLGFEILAVAPNDDPAVGGELQKLGIAYREIPLARNGFNPLMDVVLLFRLIGIIFRYKPTFVLSYTIKPVIYGSLAAAFFRKIKAFALVTGLGYLETHSSGTSKLFIRKVIRLLYKTSLCRIAGIIFQNEEDRSYFIDHKLITKKTPSIVVSGSGVNLGEYLRKASVVTPVRFLLVSRLLKSKGVSLFVEAAAALKKNYPRTEFHLIGQFDEKNPDGIDKAWLMHRVDRGDVIFHGFQKDVRDILGQASVFVLPSHYREGLPRTILEAMAMGKPVITTDNTGCRETVNDRVNGFLIPVKDQQRLQEAMREFITDPTLIATMGEKSYQLASQKFDVRIVNHDIVRFINSLL